MFMKIKYDLNFIKKMPSKSIALVANDSGGAYHLAAWLRNYYTKLKFSVSGEALKIFKNTWPKFDNLKLKECLKNTNLLISGTSKSSINLEHNARKLANQLSIPSIAVVDHWINYRERFIRNHDEILPTQIWVSDNYAKDELSKIYPQKTIIQLPNQFLLDKVTDFKKIRNIIRKKSNEIPAINILYLTEPIKEFWKGGGDFISEYQALFYFLNSLPELKKKAIVSNNNQLKIRIHPSEKIDKYYDILNICKGKNLKTSFDNSINIENALAWADIVFGCETQSLNIAIACDIPTYSTLPPNAPRCVIRNKKLIILKDFIKI